MRARFPDIEGFVERGDGVSLFYEVYGSGEPTVLLIAPWAFTPARVWKAQIPYLARHFRVVTFDPRGNGRSGRPTDAMAYAPDLLAGDALAVMDATDTGSAVIATAGPGVPHALLLAADHPERVSGAFLITPDPWPAERYVESLSRGELDAYDGWDKFNFAYWQRDWPGFARWWVETRVCTAPHSTKQAEDGVAWLLQTDAAAAIANVAALGLNTRESTLSAAGRVRCPVLIVYDDGRQIAPADTWTPLVDATGGRLLKIDGANLAGTGRYPVPFNLALREFAESVREAPTPFPAVRA